MYSQCMPRMHLNDLRTNTCGLDSRRGTCFWDSRSRMCNEVWIFKCEKEGKAYILHWKSMRMWAQFQTSQNIHMCSNLTKHPHVLFLKTTMQLICFARYCCSLSYSSFSGWTSWTCGCFYTLSSLPFLCQAPSSFFLFSFWRHDNETASAATALRSISVHNFL